MNARQPSRLLPGLVAIVAILTWGVFAFGAVYSWAYWPLAGACAGQS